MVAKKRKTVRDGNYQDKLEAFLPRTDFSRLDPEQQAFIRQLATGYRFTYQELRLVSEAARDLQMWQETPLRNWWKREESRLTQKGRSAKKLMLRRLETWLTSLRRAAKSFPEEGLERPAPSSRRPTAVHSDKEIVGKCPVASEETICCNLLTIDAVENCGFACSYCTVQTFYGDQIIFDTGIDEKLKKLELEKDRFYHLGTGQSSDSLMWGNQYGLLDSLCRFAGENPNILLEFKTKSENVAYFLKRELPRNIVLSWSLNTPTIIRNEEHLTAGLDERLTAARRVADRQIKVAFHFHPLVYYENWHEEYRRVAEKVMARFVPEEILFISFGTVTFIKPIVKAIRRSVRVSKMLQMELVPGAKGKLSYPDAVKEKMFRDIYQAFAPWHDKVFMYLCMEKPQLWKSTFGFVYRSNEEFESDFGRQASAKLLSNSRRQP